MSLFFGTSDLDPNIQGYVDKNMLNRLTPNLVHQMYGETRPVPKNMGTKINFTRVSSLAIAGMLTEGQTPTGKKPSVSRISASLFQLGDFIQYTDWFSMVEPSRALFEFSDLLAEQAELTVDTYARDTMIACSSVRYANGVAARASIDKTLQAKDVKACIRILEGNNCKTIQERILAGKNVSTQGIDKAYICITHTDARQDWEDLPGFTKVTEYPSGKALPYEIGSFGMVRVLATTNAKKYLAGGAAVGATGLVAEDSTNVDVYTGLIFGKGAFGHVPLQKKTIETIVKKLGYNDELNQKGSFGWKAAMATKILDDDRCIRFEFGVTSL